MRDLHDYHLCLAHGWGKAEARLFSTTHVRSKTPKGAHTIYPHFVPAKDLASEPVIPEPSLFETLHEPSPACAVTGIPSVGECATHLELLEAIYYLRTEVISTKRLDGALGLGEPTKKVWRKTVVNRAYKHVQLDILADREYPGKSKRKWTIFLALAVLRFELWAVKVDTAIRQGEGTEAILPHLPPLDVLVVWHAFLLNPSDYGRYIERRGLGRLALVPFPWDRIHNAIRSRPAEVGYEISSPDATWFRETIQQPVVLFDAMEGSERSSDDAVSRALLAYGGECCEVPPIDSILSEMGNGHENYSFVRLIFEAQQAVAVENPLVGNVIRQGLFVDKMHTHLWLRSPSADATLRRAIDRYHKLTQLFRDYPGETLVPTLDMDLAWHTHQLSHWRYRHDISAITGRFIDHDDKIGKETLDLQEDETRRLYEDSFDEEYCRCMCWDCEAIFSAVEADDEVSTWDVDRLGELAAKVRDDLSYSRAAECVRRKSGPRWAPGDEMPPLPTREKVYYVEPDGWD